MKLKNIIPKSNSIVDCDKWVLTSDGTNIIVDYVIQKALS
jgi:hypothetical protein